ncbi:E3 ubiquitin-protein ligase BRE1-like 1 [Andrographis paniculata]|uniref:E3 ubiquitin-protein ligase BRE1-like 1 n=1 Tax=Andrographis paniculata TaxID=175694 RepID=UPI0021E71B7F|nr:E3 ubiquitin-protein ligase BRE1-like 1 [Andrographis paniculata]XP_051144597.1 E3 ubiquitin-protein ligase BRE1-like 1 [Andrographis paniculata]XP_051144606.1 E3 ubiquitin-protein ligase BRE1-like 1 [Andrographis paniculata]
MGSTGEADKKRRHLSSVSPTAKKQPLTPLSEGKKLDATVLQFQNQKLIQKLETQKVEICGLEGRLCQLKDEQQSHDKIATIVNNSWEELVDELESCSNTILDSGKHGQGFGGKLVKDDGDSSPEESLLSRVLDSDVTESASTSVDVNEDENVEVGKTEKPEKIFRNIVVALDDLNELKNRLYTAYKKAASSNEQSQTVVSSGLQSEVKSLRVAAINLHLKHRSLAGELQSQRDTDAKNKAALKRLEGELESTIFELEETNRNLAILRAERDIAKGSLLNRGNKLVANDRTRDKQGDLQNMESTLKELLDHSTVRLHELQQLHEDRLDVLRHLSKLQSKLKNVKCISSSQAYRLIKDQLEKAKTDVVQFQALCEQLQVDKEVLHCREKEVQMKSELVDVLRRSSAVSNSRISDLEAEIQRCIKEKHLIETKLDEASKEPGGKEIMLKFRDLVSSFPEKMGSMQTQLAKHKESAADIHCLRADVASLTNILNHKAKELETLTSRSAQQNAEIKRLQDVISDLKVTDKDLKLFLGMYEQQSTDSREVEEARSSEIAAWAHVQGLKSSLDEHNLELRVKVAIESEAKAQQKLAASEAEIAELRQKLEASKREKAGLSDVLKSKHEETEAYLSEIETIGQAYDDMQTQNQQLLQQITERDDYNVKLLLEGVRSRHVGDALLMEKRMLEKAVLQSKKTVDFGETKARRIEDQLQAHSDHMKRLTDDRTRNASAAENAKRKLLDVKKLSQQTTGTLDEGQSQVEKARAHLTELQIESEKERFGRKRVEEKLDTLKRKAEQLKLQADSSSATVKLRQELQEYKEILKCTVCHERRKEVVITKCFHLFCNPCIQRIVEARHRKCPVCSASFGANDVKPVYI